MVILLFFFEVRGISVTPAPVDPWRKSFYSYQEARSVRYIPSSKRRKAVAPETLDINLLLPPKTYGVYKVNFNEKSVEEMVLPDYNLTPVAEEIVEEAPEWLKTDLLENLRRMDVSLQSKMADLILNNEDPKIMDELYFQIAHLSISTLSRIDPQLLVVNAHYIYEIDEELSYVDVVDYGTFLSDSDYYSTTKYRVIDKNGDTIWVEIPRDVYYWWVVMPKGTDEIPSMGAEVYNKFWREYLYYGDETYDYTNGGEYPLLRDYLKKVKVLWDGKKYIFSGDREHSDTMSFVNALGIWVAEILPQKASGDRPIQPNVIAYEHNGNCGEIQDLIWAAGRTGLVPFLGTLDINEDHVWNAIYFPLDSTWYPYQVDWAHGATHVADSSIAYDKDRGGGKYVSCVWNWRGDGYQFSFIEPFSNSCTLTVHVVDKDGFPYAGFNVDISSEGWQTTQLWRGFGGVTDRNGNFTTTLGEEQNYYVSGMGKVIDSADAVSGSHFEVEHKLTYSWPYGEVNHESREKGPGTGWYIYCDLESPFEMIHGSSFSYESYSQIYTYKTYPGLIEEFYITTEDQISKIGTIQKVKYYDIRENVNSIKETFPITNPEDVVVVLYNPHPMVSVAVKGKIGVTDKEGIISPEVASKGVTFFRDLNHLNIHGEEVEIFNNAGRFIGKVKGEELMQYKLPSGVYFIRIRDKGRENVIKVIKLK